MLGALFLSSCEKDNDFNPIENFLFQQEDQMAPKEQQARNAMVACGIFEMYATTLSPFLTPSFINVC